MTGTTERRRRMAADSIALGCNVRFSRSPEVGALLAASGMQWIMLDFEHSPASPHLAGDIALGFSPQLPLEAALAEAGGFDGLGPAVVAELAFWRLSGGEPAGEEKPVKGDAAELAREAHGGLEALIWAFDDPATPYRARPRPRHAPRFDDYSHLARIQEWSAGSGE